MFEIKSYHSYDNSEKTQPPSLPFTQRHLYNYNLYVYENSKMDYSA